MSPFAQGQSRPKPSLLERFSERRALLVFALCLMVGLVMVAWRTKGRIETAGAIARTEARARGASLELQLGQASSAAEVLGALARQGRGGLTDFQKVATELLTAHPGLASLELQPGGVINDVVPRAGHERTLGFNVLKDPGQRGGANETITRRALTVAGPVTLDHGEQGIVARVPVFQRTSDGRDSFWGFVAATMRLQEALARAQMDDLVRQGYDFALFVPPANRQKAVLIASHGLSSLQDTVQQPIRAQNLEFRLALKPRGGWIDSTKVVLESLAVLVISALISLSVNLQESRRVTEADLKETTQRLAREAADRNQAQENCRGTKERMTVAQVELKQTQLALQQAESKAAQFQARLDASDRAREETAQGHQAGLKEAHAALQQAQETIAQLQSRLDGAAQAEKDAASVAQERLQQNQTAMAELQARLEETTRSARATAQTSATKVVQLEQSNRELKARLLVAERAEARITELNGLLQKAQEELRHRQGASTGSPMLASAEPDDTGSRREPSAEIPEKEKPAQPPPVVAEASTKVKEERPSSIPSAHDMPGQTEPSTSESVPLPSSGTGDSMLPLEAVAAEPSVVHKASRAPKNKKARRDDQLGLFGDEVSAAPVANQSTAEAAAMVLETRKPKIPAIEPAVPFETPSSDLPKITNGQGKGQASPQEISKRSGSKPHPTLEPETAGAEVQLDSGTTPREPSRHLPPSPPVDPAQLRKAVNLILPLLAERDPGAKECVRDNRKTFRSAFTPEAYAEFEQWVKNGDFEAALEQLKKAARKYGINA